MSTDEIIDFYANLLILQYKGKPKAYAMIQALVGPVIMDQLPNEVQNAFGLDTAVGVQLDVIGIYVGVVRSGYVNGLPITLDDPDFASLIRMAIVTNSSGSSLSDIQNLLQTFFPNQVFVFDYANMHMSYFVNESVGSLDLVRLFISEGLLPKPMGVQLASVIYGPIIDKFFGCCSYQQPVAHNNSPFNDYTAYTTDTPWLSYTDAV